MLKKKKKKKKTKCYNNERKKTTEIDPWMTRIIGVNGQSLK